jgi:hypothetical protein
MAEGWSERRHLLTEGKLYLVRRDVDSPTTPGFVAGEVLRLRDFGYIPYDNSWVYDFEAADGSLRSFWLHDIQDASRVRETFEENEA